MSFSSICSMLDVLVQKFERRDDLSPAQRRAILRLPVERLQASAGETIVREERRQTSSLLLLSGYAGRVAFVGDGGRQFTQIGLPGDFLDLHSLVMKRMENGVMAISDCELATIPHSALRRLASRDPHLARMFWLETVVDAAIHRVWLVGLGRQDAQARMAHFFCEIFTRLEPVGRTAEGSFDFPLNQNDLADVLGLSSVHVNRTLMALRAADLLDVRDGRAVIKDWDGLSRVAEFDPQYLRLWKEAV